MKYSAPLKHIVQRLTASQKPNTSRHALKIHGHVKALANAVESMEAIATNRDPTQTEAAHEVRIAKAARQLMQHGEKMKAQLHDGMAEGLGDINGEIRTKNNFSAHPVYGPEVRHALRLMTDQQRHDVVRQALDKGDGQTMAAIMEAPEVTTGLDPKQMTAYREAFEKKHTPELVEQREELYESFDAGLVALRNADNAAREWLKPGRLREIEEAQERHSNATRSFESSVQAV
ncbi:hypothetical protein QLQ85_19755 [Halomonas sp. M4R5S39]|uniref:hypothetical protein n=1 Tax=Halomonas kalidii TaxID=3043293 RepID=UPI0024A7F22D|nr:hypothetical protein [Halomonas kalidii]MDI5987025.1 hypothetical protein [Halomonas kalidii]